MKTFLRITILALLIGSSVLPASASFWSDLVDSVNVNGGGSATSNSAKVSKNDLLVGGGDNSALADTNVTIRENFLRVIGTYMIGLLGIVSVAVFLYLGFILFSANGHEDDFKKAWK